VSFFDIINLLTRLLIKQHFEDVVLYHHVEVHDFAEETRRLRRMISDRQIHDQERRYKEICEFN
jgi:hypothetical protein